MSQIVTKRDSWLSARKSVILQCARSVKNIARSLLRGLREGACERTYSSAFIQDPTLYEFVRTLRAYEKITGNTTLLPRADADLLRMFYIGTHSLKAARSFLRLLPEEATYWFKAHPTELNSLAASNVERFYETGPELVETIVGAIECGQHVALAGPRGCGKSFCIDDAIKLALERALLPENGFIKIQGNKELPRDYLIEDDVTLTVSDENVVTPTRKDAPLFRFAERDHSGRPLTPKGAKYVLLHGRDNKGELLSQPMRDDQIIALFLDEVNRFSDGVLDSLLLLLEEGQVIMGGDPFKLKVVVLMTMNPPGYDASARVLSPPLSARIGRQYRLLTPQINVLTDIVAPPVIKNLLAGAKQIHLKEPPHLLLRRAAAVTLCCWGLPNDEKPGFEYLSPEMRALTTNLADTDPTLKTAMQSLNQLCHYGPDARALLDWLKASSVAATNEARTLNLGVAEIRGRHFIETSISVLAHKVQDSFSAASRPDNTRRKEEAIHTIVRAIIDGGPLIRDLLHRKIDEEASLQPAASVLWSVGEAEKLRAAIVTKRVAQDDAVKAWTSFIINLPIKDEVSTQSIKKLLVDLHLGEPIGQNGFAFSSEAYQKFMLWLSEQKWDGVKSLTSQGRKELKGYLQEVSEEQAYPNTINRYIERLRCVQDRVWPNDDALLAHIGKAGVRTMERSVLREVADIIDYFWIRAEHHGEEVAYQIQERIAEIPVPASLRKPMNQMLVEAAKHMSEHKARGRNSRRAWRKLRELMA